MIIETSDWVLGNTENGELIHGFADAIDERQGIVKVYIVHSDNKEAIGTVAALRENRVRKLPDSTIYETASLRDLMDLALLTRDEAWFMELSEQLRSAGQKSDNHGKYTVDYSSYKNRLLL
ncbi:IDEAL domain-containing protein [Paenibacillus tarimensis]